LDEWLSADCIACRQKQRLETHTDDSDRNKVLFQILRRGSLANYYTFIHCLVETKQLHVASLLAPHIQEGVRPLNELHTSLLLRNHAAIVKFMNSQNSGLLTELLANNCLKFRLKEYIESATTQTEINERLLNVIRRGSDVNFNTFLDCLRNTRQQPVCLILLEDELSGHLITTVSDTNHTKRCQIYNVDQLLSVLRNISDEQGEQVYGEILKHLDDLRKNKVQHAAAKTENNFRLLCFCGSLRGIQYLYAQYSCERLKVTLQELTSMASNIYEPICLRVDFFI
jgi:hypothetical protein